MAAGGVAYVSLAGNPITAIDPSFFSGWPRGPSSTPADLVLDLGNTSVAALPAGWAAGFEGSLSLFVQNCALTSVTPGMVETNASHLRLDMTGNRVTSLGPGILAGFGGGQLLVALENNRITQLAAGLFSELFATERPGRVGPSGVQNLALNLEGNGITSLPADLFAPFTAELACPQGCATGTILNLYLSYNRISALPSSAFAGFHGSILNIKINTNSVTALNPAAFAGFSGQQLWLYVNNNAISTIPAGLASQCNVAYFYVSVQSNGLSELQPGAFAQFSTEQFILIVQNNSLVNLPPGTFANFSGAYLEIDARNNRIERVVDGLFSAFTGSQLEVHLDYNRISDVATRLFDGVVASSIGLHLGNNLITSLPANTFGSVTVSSFTATFESNQISLIPTAANNGVFANVTASTSCTIDVSNNLVGTAGMVGMLRSYRKSTAALTIDMSGNRVDAVPASTFDGVGVEAPGWPAVLLNLANNRVTALSGASMLGFAGTGVTLVLRNNSIGELPVWRFTPNTANRYRLASLDLNLAQNAVTVLSMSALAGFPGKSVVLDLSENRLTSLDHFSFETEHHLDFTYSLTLRDNTITAVSSSFNFANVTAIDLTGNHITVLLNNTFPAPAMTSLLLGGNRITLIEQGAVQYSLALKILNLSHNTLTMLPASVPANAPNLEVLDVGFNDIGYFPATASRVFHPAFAGNNTLTCNSYSPNLQGCFCARDLVFNMWCGYGRCTPTTTGCLPGEYRSQDCSSAPASVCLATRACAVDHYAIAGATATSDTVCAAVANCSSQFPRGKDGGYLDAYQYRAPTATSDRACSICATCPVGFDTVPCTETADSTCTQSTGLSAGSIASIVLSIILVLILAAGFAYWGMQQQRVGRAAAETLKLTTDELELTERLLDEGEQTLEAIQNSWRIEWSSITLGRALGKGSFGEVREGEWLGSKVAVKQLLFVDESQVNDAAYDNEVAAMCELHHPNLVTFFGSGANDSGLAFMVTELMDGTLRDLLAEGSDAHSWSDRRRFCADIVAGLLFLHTRSPPMIHRDLKSDNCLVGTHNVVKLADFGTVARPGFAAVAEGGAQTSSSFTMTATLGAGTPLWMAPEVLQGKHGVSKYGPGVDVYSFGIVMWEIATSRLPFDTLGSEGMFAFFEAIGEGARPDIPPGLPPPFRVLMVRCWDADPSARPTTAELHMAVSKLDISPLERLSGTSTQSAA